MHHDGFHLVGENPKTVKRLRGILTRKVQERTKTIDVDGLRRQLGKVDTQLATARRNMVLAGSADLRVEYETGVREPRSERERLDASIQDAQKPPGHAASEMDQCITKAVESLARLCEAVKSAPIPRQRELLATCIKKVQVWSTRPTPKGPFLLERGVVHLRSDMWLAGTDNLFGSGGSTTKSPVVPAGPPMPARISRSTRCCHGGGFRTASIRDMVKFRQGSLPKTFLGSTEPRQSEFPPEPRQFF
jgi:hypothetical protein